MLNKDFKKILKILLKSESYFSSNTIAQKLNLSSKTVRVRIAELNTKLKDLGCNILSKPRHGYILEVKNKKALEDILNRENINEISDFEFFDFEYRANFLFDNLFNKDGYVKADDLAELLDISKPTLTGILKKLELKLNFYELKLERRPNYGMRITGSEFDIRNCLSQNFIQRRLSLKASEYFYVIVNASLDVFKSLNLNVSEVNFESIVVYIYISVDRIKKGKYVESLKNCKVKETSILASFRIYQKTENVLKMKFDDNEIQALSLHIDSKTSTTLTNSSISKNFKKSLSKQGLKEDKENKEKKYKSNTQNIIVSDELRKLSYEMIYFVYERLKIDFRNNFNLLMNLNRHLAPLDIRIRYNMSIKNPVTEDVKNNYSLAYVIAKEVSIVLKNYYGKEISDDEICYIAVIFEIALEENKEGFYKYNLLIVCSLGRTATELLARKYKNEFADYIENIYMSDLVSLDRFDFSKIDYIVSTVDIDIKAPVPIIKTGLFFEKKDLDLVGKTFKTSSYSFIDKYFKESLFCPMLKAKSMEEALENICLLLKNALKEKALKDDCNIPNFFLESVIERESMIPTDFGYLCALPHPMTPLTKNSFAFIAVLEKPIIWNKNPVQVIFLISISKSEKEDLHNFYSSIASFIYKKDNVKKLIEKRDFNVLKELLKDF